MSKASGQPKVDYKTPKVTAGYTADSQPYKVSGVPTKAGSSTITYHPIVTIDPLSYGKDGGKPAAISGVPSVVVGGSSEVGAMPSAFDGDFGVGDDKNVSTPVSG